MTLVFQHVVCDMINRSTTCWKQTRLNTRGKVMHTEIWCVCKSCYNMFIFAHWKCSQCIFEHFQ